MSKTDAVRTFDLTNCESEPIHFSGAIQPHGVLLALDPGTLLILQVGGDTGAFLGYSPAALLNKTADHIFNTEQIVWLRNFLEHEHLRVRPVHAFSLTLPKDGKVTDVFAHLSTGLLILEIEPAENFLPSEPLAFVQTMLADIREQAKSCELSEAVVSGLRKATGYDRVMAYRFATDGSGTVIAEARAVGAHSYLDQHFPESDIPKQARALYLRNWVRIIPDARYAPAPIVPDINPKTGYPLDLSQSYLRSVSAMHRQYMANMGVAASMSLSIILHGQLWGLIVCHHFTARYLSQRLGLALELFAEMVSSLCEARIVAEEAELRQRTSKLHHEFVSNMSCVPDLATGLLESRPNLLDFIPAGGVCLWLEGRFSSTGETPDAEQTAALVAWLNAHQPAGVFHSECLPLLYPPAERFADVGSGVLALSVSRSPRDYVLWFRPEVIRTVVWGGDPTKPVSSGPGGETLTPRSSFAAWKQSVHLHAKAWRPSEVDTAHQLRLSLLEVVLQRIDQIAREREIARLYQQKLAEELDHRLAQWRATGFALHEESQRRAQAEAELSSVLRRTVEAQEAERTRIARELHDSLGQSLTLLQLGLDALGRSCALDDDVQQRLTMLKDLTVNAGREIGRLAWELRPTALDDLGLPNAVRNLLEDWGKRSELEYDLHLSLGERRLSSEVETTLYRVLQEALTNIVRHAAATRIGVILGIAEQQVTMIIEDNGRGFGWDESRQTDLPGKRLGLLGIRERLALLGGTFEVETAPGRGTTLFVRTPA